MENIDSNLTPAQRVWKRRRNRWNRFNHWRAIDRQATVKTWQQALNGGSERAFLKREGEGE